MQIQTKSQTRRLRLSLRETPLHQALTKCQRDALEWVGRGKALQDIATSKGADIG